MGEGLRWGGDEGRIMVSPRIVDNVVLVILFALIDMLVTQQKLLFTY